MSWLYSRALVEAFSGGGCSDGALSAPSSGSPTPQAYLPPDRMTAFSRTSRFGMTFAPLTDDHGAAVLTSFLAAFPARTSAWPAKALALTEPDQACGPTWRASLARFDPVTSSWKTAQRSLLGDSGESSVIWPRSGMTAAGQCWELPTLERSTNGTGSGLLPTPLASNTKAHHMRSNGRPARSYIPTPTAQEGSGGGTLISKIKAGRQVHLRDWVKTWPTPMAADSRGSSGRPTPGKQVQLVDAVKFATPLSRDYRSGKASQATHDKNSRPLSEQIGGSLNPTWVEWLMGWPLGWTVELKVRSFHRYLKSIGWNEWDSMLGIRADEPRRLAKIGNQDYGKHEQKVAPLGRARVTKEMVGEFWRNQPFDLGLPNMNGVTVHGNCDLCFLKTTGVLASLVSERPERAVWWARMEKYAEGLATNPRAARFHMDRPSYAGMAAFAAQQRDMFDPNEEAIACFCGE